MSALDQEICPNCGEKFDENLPPAGWIRYHNVTMMVNGAESKICYSVSEPCKP